MDLISNALVGAGFGFALQKARVFDPAVIQGQLLLTDFTMMQTFLQALGTSQLVMAVGHYTPHAKRFTDCHSGYCGRKQGKLSAVVGGSVLGVGMALAGACPGTIYSQLGSGVPGTSIVMAGAVTGILLFSAVEKLVHKTLHPVARNNKKLVDQSFPLVATISGFTMIAVSNAFKTFAPNSPIPAMTNLLESIAWTPQMAGLMIGLMQYPSMVLLGGPMGMSSALVAVSSPVAHLIHKMGFLPKESEAVKSIGSFFDKLVYVFGVVGGAWISSTLSGTFGTAVGLTTSTGIGLPIVYSIFPSAQAQAFVGGVMLWLGARIAGGCTSGHGISGCSFFNTNSLLAVPAMFAGGILTSLFLSSF